VMDDGEREAIWSAIHALHWRAPLDFVEADGLPALDLLRERSVAVESMGRGPEDDPAFFLAAGAAGAVAAGLRPQRSR